MAPQAWEAIRTCISCDVSGLVLEEGSGVTEAILGD